MMRGDILSVRLLNAAGELLSTVLQRDNADERGAWIVACKAWDGDFPYASQTLRLSLDMVTNERANTNLFVDDVSFFVSSKPIAGAVCGSSSDSNN